MKAEKGRTIERRKVTQNKEEDKNERKTDKDKGGNERHTERKARKYNVYICRDKYLLSYIFIQNGL
jgi:hypothetical protein